MVRSIESYMQNDERIVFVEKISQDHRQKGVFIKFTNHKLQILIQQDEFQTKQEMWHKIKNAVNLFVSKYLIESCFDDIMLYSIVPKNQRLLISYELCEAFLQQSERIKAINNQTAETLRIFLSLQCPLLTYEQILFHEFSIEHNRGNETAIKFLYYLFVLHKLVHTHKIQVTTTEMKEQLLEQLEQFMNNIYPSLIEMIKNDLHQKLTSRKQQSDTTNKSISRFESYVTKKMIEINQFHTNKNEKLQIILYQDFQIILILSLAQKINFHGEKDYIILLLSVIGNCKTRYENGSEKKLSTLLRQMMIKICLEDHTMNQKWMNFCFPNSNVLLPTKKVEIVQRKKATKRKFEEIEASIKKLEMEALIGLLQLDTNVV